MDADLAEELAFHQAMKQTELERSGLRANDAEFASRRALGNATLAREDARAVWVWRWLDDLGRDLTYATRSLKKNPSFSAVAVLTLALGIGANTAIFSVVDAVLLHPVPFPEPEQLVALHGKSDTTGWSAVSYPNLLDWQRQTRTLEAIAAWRIDFFTLIGQNQAERLKGGRVSASYFSILRVRPLLGRTFQPSDDQLGAPPVVVLGEGLWTRRFARDPLIIGQNITLDGRPHTVVGVMPGYVGLGVIPRLINDVFLPIGQYEDKLFLSRGVYATDALGRLKPGVTLIEVRAEMDGIAQALAASYPEVNTGQGIYVVPVTDDLVGSLRPMIWLLVGVVAFVLLIACANVANLTLARAIGRTQEFAVRVALGANRGRIVRQVLAEHLLLSIAGGTIGVVLASWGTRSALAVLPSALPDSVHVGTNIRVLALAIGVTSLTGILSGLISALKVTQPHLQGNLKQDGHDGAMLGITCNASSLSRRSHSR
jgi:predicted permease